MNIPLLVEWRGEVSTVECGNFKLALKISEMLLDVCFPLLGKRIPVAIRQINCASGHRFPSPVAVKRKCLILTCSDRGALDF